MPDAEQTAKYDELADMVGIVVGDQEKNFSAEDFDLRPSEKA